MPIDDEDRALFQESMKTVTPLKQTIQREQIFRTHPPITVRKKNLSLEVTPTQYALSNHYTTIQHAESILSFCHSSLTRKRLLDLKQGKIPYTGRLDLHGLTPDTARDVLCEFIDRQYKADSRCVLIIHGKGGRFNEAPILKNLVYHWLPQLPQILAFHSANPRDGGNGALYVLLKKQKP